MPPKPKKKQSCPVCHLPMKWFGDHWVCINIKTHDKTLSPKMGTVVPYKKRRRR